MGFIPKILSVFALLFLAGIPLALHSQNPPNLTAQFPFDPTRISESATADPLAYYEGQVVGVPPVDQSVQNQVLGDTTAIKRIQVDLTNQRLYAFEGERLVYSFIISSGKYNRTPTGKFKVWTKIRSQKMSGGSREQGTYYYLPNVPYIMFFYNDKVNKKLGYSLHGTYWHDNFGVPMSHGGINMRTEDAEKIYYWINPELRNGKSSIAATTDNPGTEIIIYGKYNPKVSKNTIPSNPKNN